MSGVFDRPPGNVFRVPPGTFDQMLTDLDRPAQIIEPLAELAKAIPHDHQTHVEGCFRCDLSRNETPVTPICPECEQGKHGNCDGTAWDDELDELTTCRCNDHAHC